MIDNWFAVKHTKGIFGNDGHVLCRFANAVLVLSADPEHVLLHGSELAGFEGGVFDSCRQLHPLLFVHLTALHDVVGDGRATVVPGRVPGHDT